MKGCRFILGCDLKVGQSLVANGHPQLVTAVEPAILGVRIIYCGMQAFIIHPNEAVQVV